MTESYTLTLEYFKDADGNYVADVSHLSDEDKARLVAALREPYDGD